MRLQRHEEANSVSSTQGTNRQEPLPQQESAREQEQNLSSAKTTLALPIRIVRSVLLIAVLLGLVEAVSPSLVGTSPLKLALGKGFKEAYSSGKMSYIYGKIALQVGDFPHALVELQKLPVSSVERKDLRVALFQSALSRNNFEVALTALNVDAPEKEVSYRGVRSNNPWGYFQVEGDQRRELTQKLLQQKGFEGAYQFAREQRSSMLATAVLAQAAETHLSQVIAIAAKLPQEEWESVATAIVLAYVREKNAPDAFETLLQVSKDTGIAMEKLIRALPIFPIHNKTNEIEYRSELIETWIVSLAARGEFARALSHLDTEGFTMRYSALRKIGSLSTLSMDQKKQVLQVLRKEALARPEAAKTHDSLVQILIIRAANKVDRDYWLSQLLNSELRQALKRQF